MCATCGDDFTRTAEIVRLVEYIVGRTSGKYSEPRPLVYGSKKWNDKNNIHRVIQESNKDSLNHKNYDPRPPITSLSAAGRTPGKILNERTDFGNFVLLVQHCMSYRILTSTWQKITHDDA